MEQYDIEGLNPLKIFLLALVEYGLATPYDLLSKAALGPGLTSPALKRLKEAGFLTSTPGPRNRVRYAITKKGKTLLEASLDPEEGNYWRHGETGIFESLPRGIVLAWLHSGADEACRGANQATGYLFVLAQKRRMEADQLRSSMSRMQASILKSKRVADKGALVGTVYQWIKAESDAARFRLEAEAIEQIVKLIADLPPAPQAHRDEGAD